MRRLCFASCLTAFCLSVSLTAMAEEFSYGKDKPAGLSHETFFGKRCYVFVHGPSGGSFVMGTYDDPDGELKISVDRFSHLTIRGRARKVIVMYVDVNCSVDLTGLTIGDGGVEIHSVDHRSHVDFGNCGGSVTIKSVDNGSAITLRAGTKVEGKNKFFGHSELNFEKQHSLE